MAYKALAATLAAVLLVVASGCHALGFTSASPIPGGQLPAGLPSPAGSAFIVAPWAIAVTLSAVVVAFVVKLLRNRVPTPGV